MKTKGAGIQNHNDHDFVFDGGLHSNSRAALVREILIYLLYERQQIPLPFEHIKRELKVIRETEENDTEKHGIKQRKRRINRLEVNRSINVVNNLDAISEHLMEAFEVCPEIKQVLLIFGGTVISPKESYCITFPAPNLDENILSTSVCIRSLLKQIIIQNIHEDCKTLNPTSMTMLFNAPRGSNISWFLPKPNFKSPVRGKQFRFNIACKRKQNMCCPDISRDETDIDISGIEPLEISMETDFDHNSQELTFTPGGHVSVEYLQDEMTPTSSKSFDDKSEKSIQGMNSHGMTNDSVEDELQKLSQEDHIWFQAPCLVKGYRDRSSRHSTQAI